MNTKLQISRQTLFTTKIKTADEAKAMIQEGEKMEQLGYIIQGKSWKFIRDGINKGEDPALKKYNTLTDYCKDESIHSSTPQFAGQLIKGYELGQFLELNGIKELPPNMHIATKIFRLDQADQIAMWKYFISKGEWPKPTLIEREQLDLMEGLVEFKNDLRHVKGKASIFSRMIGSGMEVTDEHIVEAEYIVIEMEVIQSIFNQIIKQTVKI